MSGVLFRRPPVPVAKAVRLRSAVRLSLVVLCLSAVFAAPGRAAPEKIRDLRPTVILVALDGFRADYLDKYRPEHLGRLAAGGVRARWMVPVFPSLTFPNHYSIATGLYAEGHGIVGNTIYDPEFGATFSMSKREEVQNGRWWQGEPIWVTAERQGQRAGIYFFPGSEAEIGGVRPTYWRAYDGDVPNSKRVDQILAWLDLPRERRPTLLALYFSDVDSAAHDHSPDSPETARAVERVDGMLGRLTSGLRARGVFEAVNIVLVSDHGMATVEPGRFVFLDDHFDAERAAAVVWGATLAGVFPKAGEEEAVYRSLTARAIEHARCYRKQDIPARFRYSASRRIPPVVCLADEGWKLTSRERYERDRVENRLKTRASGEHGYDNQLESMRALFVAHGPAFKKGAVVEPFESVSVYNMMAAALGLRPARNDGSPEAARRVLR